MKAVKSSSAKTRAKTLAAPWLERPGVEMTLRIATAALMSAAASLVLVHVVVYSGGLVGTGPTRTQPAACTFVRC
jgi:hypothetical protein